METEHRRVRDPAQQKELTHERIDGEIPKEMLLEFTAISDRTLQDDEDAACRSQQPPSGKTRSSNSGQSQRRSDVPEIDPISGIADAVRRSQQKVQPASRMEISRDSE